MVPKPVAAALACVALLFGGVSRADGYRPGDFLGLTLEQAALSPKPLGPPTQFAPVPVEDKADIKADIQPDVKPDAKPSPDVTIAQVRPARRHVPAVGHARLARSHRNPLDAQAFDTRIQSGLAGLAVSATGSGHDNTAPPALA